MSKLYRKKPVVIEAEQWTGPNLNDDNSLFQDPSVIIKNDGSEFMVATLEGIMTGNKGDWLIRGVKGELYPCKPDIFAATYEEVNTMTLAEEDRISATGQHGCGCGSYPVRVYDSEPIPGRPHVGQVGSIGTPSMAILKEQQAAWDNKYGKRSPRS